MIVSRLDESQRSEDIVILGCIYGRELEVIARFQGSRSQVHRLSTCKSCKRLKIYSHKKAGDAGDYTFIVGIGKGVGYFS
jgi:hypothetical protein